MNGKTWLVLDVSYLAWRAFHTTGGLSYRGSPTGVTFGVLKTVQHLTELHGTGRVIFCFDKGQSIRKQIDPKYKAKRHSKVLTPEQEEKFQEVRKQITLMRTKYLPKLGTGNVFSQEGYEGDDIIASVVRNVRGKDEAIIVSADHDLWQLVNSRVSVYNPTHKIFHTKEWILKEYGIKPHQWKLVKAIAGCSSDEVPGAGRGIAEKTAAKYVAKGMLSPALKKKIEDWMETKQYELNLQLVGLPLDGCRDFKPKDDVIDPVQWKRLTASLGMRSLQDRPPESRRGFGL